MKVLIPTKVGTLTARNYFKSKKTEKLIVRAAHQVIQVEDPELRNDLREELLCAIFVEKGLTSFVDQQAFFCLEDEDRVEAAKTWIIFSMIQDTFSQQLETL